MSLYDPIPLVFTPAFEVFFRDVWSKHNNFERLSAQVELIQIGAFLEYTYIERGADDDQQEFRDVIVPKHLCSEHFGVVDCKTSQVKKSRSALLSSVLDRHKGKNDFFLKHKIEKIHHWTWSENDLTLRPWFVKDIKSGSITFIQTPGS